MRERGSGILSMAIAGRYLARHVDRPVEDSGKEVVGLFPGFG